MLIASSSWGEWVWWGTGWGVVAVAAGVVVWALFWDRSRGRRRCSRCWYDMQGVGLTCPECGRVAADERGLRRTRPHWTWAFAAVGIGLFGWQLTDSRRDAEGWTRIVPTRALKLAAMVTKGWAEDPVRPLIFGREIGGSASALKAWMSLTTDEEGARRTVRTRAKWPETITPLVRFDDVSAAVPTASRWMLVVECRDDARPTMQRRLYPPSSTILASWAPDYGEEELQLPVRGLGHHRERLVVSIVTSDGCAIGRWNVDVAYEMVRTLDEAVPPLDSDELREKIRRSLRARETRTPERAGFHLIASEGVPELGALHLKGDVLVDGRVVGELVKGRFAVEPASDAAPEPRVLVGDVRKFPFDAVTLRLTGDQWAAAHDFDALGYWSGTMEFSLAELLRPRP